MELSTGLLKSVCLFCVTITVVRADHYTLDYECQPNSDVVVQNPDIGILKSATAGTSTGVCNVSMTTDTSVFTVSGCAKDIDIQFTLSTRGGAAATGDGIIGGSYSETYVLLCLEIDETGVVFNANFSMNVDNEVATSGNVTGNVTGNATTHAPMYSEAPVTPTFSIYSSIWNSAQTTVVSNANVGDILKWKVHGPIEYDLLPFSCTVNPGPVYGAPPVVTVVDNGCSAVDMVTTFAAAGGDPTLKYEVVSDLYVFKFTMSDEVTFVCSVKICTRGDAACQASCSKRKRREANDTQNDLAGLRASVVSHLKIGDSGAAIHGLAYILLISTCIMTLGQSLL